jgi:hypothetical protein
LFTQIIYARSFFFLLHHIVPSLPYPLFGTIYRVWAEQKSKKKKAKNNAKNEDAKLWPTFAIGHKRHRN